MSRWGTGSGLVRATGLAAVLVAVVIGCSSAVASEVIYDPRYTCDGRMWTGSATAFVAAPRLVDEVDLVGVDTFGTLIHGRRADRHAPWTAEALSASRTAGAPYDRPAVARSADGRLEVWAPTGVNYELTHWWQAGDGTWRSRPTGEIARSPAVGVAPDGRLELFAVDRFSRLLHQWQLTPNGAWSSWRDTGLVAGESAPGEGAPGVARNADGRLEVMVVNLDGALMRAWQLTPNGGWSSWQWTGTFASGAPVAANAPDGRIELWATDRRGGLLHSWQRTPNGVWSDWHWTGAVIEGRPSVAVAPDGRLELFARDRCDDLLHRFQTSPGGAWTAWARPVVRFEVDPLARTSAAGRIELVSIEDGDPVTAEQPEPNGWWDIPATVRPAAGLGGSWHRIFHAW